MMLSFSLTKIKEKLQFVELSQFVEAFRCMYLESVFILSPALRKTVSLGIKSTNSAVVHVILCMIL
jgi:hypothetical protein